MLAPGQGIDEDAVAAAALAAEAAKVAPGTDAPGPAQPEAAAPISITSSVVSNGKHIKVVIEDAAAIGELVSAATGHPELATAIGILTKYIGTAIQGAEDASVILINHDSIAALLKNVKLDPPTS